MDPHVSEYFLSPYFLMLPVLGILLLLLLLLMIRRRVIRGRSKWQEQHEATWKRPDVDEYSGLRSPFHAWDMRIKIASLMLYVFCVGALTTLGWAIVAVGISVGAARLARFPFEFLAKRMLLVVGFLGMFFVVMPLTVRAMPGDVLYRIEGLEFIRVNPRGLLIALLVFSKATAIVVMTLPLLGTSPFPVTIRALGSLRVPQVVIQMILLSYRYLFVFANEMQRMATAMKSRGFRSRTDLRTLRTIGNFVGILLVRSFERTERVYQAMLSRGYSGRLVQLDNPPVRAGDWIMGALWVGVGLLLVTLDRMVPLTGLFGFGGN